MSRSGRPRGRKPDPTPEHVRATEIMAARMSSALEQCGAASYHLGAMTAQYFVGALAHGMPEPMAVDLTQDMLAHMLHAGLPVPDEDDSDDGDNGDVPRSFSAIR